MVASECGLGNKKGKVEVVKLVRSPAATTSRPAIRIIKMEREGQRQSLARVREEIADLEGEIFERNKEYRGLTTAMDGQLPVSQRQKVRRRIDELADEIEGQSEALVELKQKELQMMEQ